MRRDILLTLLGAVAAAGALTLAATVDPAGKRQMTRQAVTGLLPVEAAQQVQPKAAKSRIPESKTEDGVYRLPFHASVYSEDFDTTDWTIDDTNADGEEWAPSESGWLIGYSEDEVMNDWLITPALHIQKDKKCVVRFRLSNAEDECTDKLDVCLGTEADAGAMTTMLKKDVTVADADWHEVVIPFTVNADGDYYLGLHCTSNVNQGGIYLQDLAVDYVTDEQCTEAGVKNAPWSEHFGSQEAYDAWTQVQRDGNDASAFAWSDMFGGMLVYNSGMAKNDDWMMSPAVYLVAGKPYQVSVDVSQPNENTTLPIEICMGEAATAEAMTQTVMPRVMTPAQWDFATLRGNVFVPAKTGKYHFGIHAVDTEGVYDGRETDFVNFTVSYVGNEKAPGAVTEVIANSKGTTVTVSLTAPAKAIDGTALTTLEKVELYRDGEFVTDDTPTPGDVIEMEDEVNEPGYYTYQIIPYNAEGPGATYSLVKLVGFGAPLDPANVKLAEVADDPSHLLLTWDAVTADAEGNALGDDDVTYAVINSRGEVLKDGITETKAMLTIDASQPSVVQAGVRAFSKGGESNGVLADMLSVGTPYELPYKESFAEAKAEKVYGFYGAGYASQPIPSGYFQGFDAVDGDGGLFIAQCSQVSDAYMQSGKITIPSDVAQPGLSFWANNVKTDNTNICGVQVNDGTGWKTLLSGQVMGSNLSNVDGGWGKIMVDLSAYKGKTIVYRITMGVRRYVNIFLDNIRIEELPSKDLAIQAVTVPSKVKANIPYNVEVSVLNQGLKSVLSSKYKIFLYRDGQRILGKGGTTLSKGASATFTFEQKMGVCDAGTHTYYAVVDYADDQDQSNNTSAETPVEVQAPSYPAPVLTATADADTARLAWTMPNLSADPMNIVESWEKADAYATAVQGWTFVDRDKNAVGGFNGITLPGWTSGSSKGSYMVWPSSVLAQIGMPAPEGSQALASIFCAGANDDWAISPQLTGEAQTVTFKAAASTYGDSFKAFYSTGSLDPADFVQVVDSTVVPNAWTDYSFALPEGAKYFALVNCSNDCFWLLFDDIHYRGTNPDASLQVKGINLYRNGELLTSLEPGTLAFADDDVCGLTHYNATVVYDMGESRVSNTAEALILPSVRLEGNVEGTSVTLAWAAPKYKDGKAMPATGYKVYRDGAALTAEPVDALTYTDENVAPTEDHVYTVTAVYADGESRPSNQYAVGPAGIDDATALSGRTEVARYDELGREVTPQYRGAVIVRYSDGSTRKMHN